MSQNRWLAGKSVGEELMAVIWDWIAARCSSEGTAGVDGNFG